MASKYAYIYAEGNADLVSDSRQSVENTGVALRRFPHNLSAGESDALIQEMWATRLYVDNPIADRKAGQDTKFRLAGRWRVSNLRKNGPQEPVGIYEELRLGWLQSPGTTNDYPKSKDADDWSGIDKQVRVVRMQEFDDTNRAVAGENRYYTLLIPGVATKTVKEFCTALAARPVIENPIFGLQTDLTGAWSIRGVRNEDQGDGSSNVICSLASVDGLPGAGGIMLNDNWNETAFQMYFKNLADYPNKLETPFPPVNVEAVVDPKDPTKQIAYANIYQVTGAGIDGSTGLWTVNFSKRTAKPDEKSWLVNDNNGQYGQGHFWNQTLAWVQFKAGTTLSMLLNNGFSATRNEFNLYDGSYSNRPVGNSGTTDVYYNTGFFYEYVTKYRWDHGGRFIMEVWRITCRYRFGKGIETGLVDFHNGVDNPTGGATPNPGTSEPSPAPPPFMEWSHFQVLGGDKYQFKRVIAADLVTKDLTNVYDNTGRYTTGSVQSQTFQPIVPGS